MVNRWSVVMLMIILAIFHPGSVRGASQEDPIKSIDLNYHYQVNYSGRVIDFTDESPHFKEPENSNQPRRKVLPRKILIEVMIESIYGGFEWLPMNPVITDNANRSYPDYKVIIEPQAGNSTISIKYLISGISAEAKRLNFYEEGLSQSGKKAYRLFLRNIPLE